MTRACRDCKWAKLPDGPSQNIDCHYGGLDESRLQPAKAYHVCKVWEPWATLVVAGDKKMPIMYYRVDAAIVEGGDDHATQGTEKA